MELHEMAFIKDSGGTTKLKGKILSNIIAPSPNTHEPRETINPTSI
jgi:hypothetical protein